MILLGIDTCGREGRLGLARVDASDQRLTPLGEVELAGRTTAAELVPALGRLMVGAGLQGSDLGSIVVVDGPGSFTGIRIGLSTAKALCESLQIPVFAVSRIEVLSTVNGGAWVLLDASRDEFYAGHREAPTPCPGSAWSRERQGSEWLISREAALTLGQLSETLCPCCAGKAAAPAVTCEEKVAATLPGAKLVPAPTALQAIEVALPEVLANRSVDVAMLDGRYVRRPAELYGQAQPTRS